MEKLERFMEWGGTKKDIAFLIISVIALICSAFHLLPMPFGAAWIAIILCGLPIIMEAIIGLVTEFDIKADVLVSIALIASVIISEEFAAGEVAVIMQLGGLLEELTVAKARAGIERLVNLTPRTARIINDDREKIMQAEEVRVGDLLRVLPGETVPVDGIITVGQTSINQAVMTGESLPVDKSAGDEVFSGTVNQFGSFDMKATKVGEDSSIQRMIRLVQSADAGKAKIVGLADRWATWIVVAALLASVITWVVTHEILRSVTILVVFCPCGMVLATPTAIMAAIGNATKHGFLVREGDALERLASVAEIAFDKTGTLTSGTPQVAAVKSIDIHLSEEQLFTLAAGAERRSEHPLGKAVVHSYQEQTGRNAPEAEQFEMVPGRGIKAEVSGKSILAGNPQLLEDNKVVLTNECKNAAESFLNEGCTVIYVAVDGRIAGLVALADTLRPDARMVIGQINRAGVSPVLLTGDNEKAAGNIADQLSITEIQSNCLPQDKLKYIDTAQHSGKKICMIGDGVNDAPALKKSYVGIAMGGIGSDIAVDAADIALVNDDIKEIPHLLLLAKRMMKTIKLNLSFSMFLNFLAIILAILGILNPLAGALVHNSGSVFVIVNSAFLLKWEKKKV